MSSNGDTLRSRIKQAIGALTGDEDLQRDGRREEHDGRVLRKAGETIDQARDTFVEDLAETLPPGKRRSE